MLQQLYIRNYALIAETQIAFERGLNIITGETGAGKSILLGAFGLLIGDRASADLIRKGADKAVVEAEFNIEGNPRLKAFLIEEQLDADESILVVRREVLARGTARGFINDTPATAQLLKELADYLVDLHGQHEHQSLLRAEGHVGLLDDYGNHAALLTKYQSVRNEYLGAQSELDALKERNTKLTEEQDFLRFQLEEIRAVSPKENEDVEIERELTVLENSEELRRAAEEVHAIIYENEGSVYEQLSKARHLLEEFGAIDSSLRDQLPELTGAIATIGELSKFLSRYSDAIESQPERLDTLRERSMSIARLKRKYGGSLEAVLTKEREFAARIGEADVLDETIAVREKEIEKLRGAATTAALKLSETRQRAAKSLAPKVVAALNDLGIEHSRFESRVERRELGSRERDHAMVSIDGKPIYSNARGIDLVEFFLSTNLGEEPKPLVKVASGGEVSRIMLALKTLLAKNERLPLMVFDEIDVGVSGRIAQKVGMAMKRLASEHQIIAITHLSQIAAFADTHFQVEKRIEKGTSVSEIRKLGAKEHLHAVAGLIAGSALSESSIAAAKSLIEESRV